MGKSKRDKVHRPVFSSAPQQFWAPVDIPGYRNYTGQRGNNSVRTVLLALATAFAVIAFCVALTLGAGGGL